MVDYTSHASLFCLMLALTARPISRLWSSPLKYRRALGVGAFVLALAHTAHMMEHTLNWNYDAIAFMLPMHQWGMVAGFLALILMTPAAVTSFDRIQTYLGKRWRQIHLLGVPAVILTAIHAALLGSHYLGAGEENWSNQLWTVLLFLAVLAVLLVRSPLFWSILSLEKYYVPSTKSR